MTKTITFTDDFDEVIFPKGFEKDAKLFEDFVELISKVSGLGRDLLNSPETLEKSRLKPTYFTRNQNLSFVQMQYYLLAHYPGSLDSTFREFLYTNYKGEVRRPIESELSRARNHFDEYPFKTLFYIVRDAFLDFEKEHGLEPGILRECGVDGSYLALPDFQKLIDRFGTYGRGNAATGRMSLIFDSIKHFIYETSLVPIDIGEREAALDMIEDLAKEVDLSSFLFIFDRGYPSQKFFNELTALGANFIIRVSENWYGLNSLKIQEGQTATGYTVHFENCPTLRAVRIQLTKDRTETIITNVMDLPAEEFKGLYNYRWPVEIDFYFIKRVLRLEDFNGYSVNSVIQDFWIAVSLNNFASLFKQASDILVQVEHADEDLKYVYQTNMSELISDLHVDIIKVLMENDDKKRKRYIRETLMYMSAEVNPLRDYEEKERKFFRIRFYFFNQKVH